MVSCLAAWLVVRAAAVTPQVAELAFDTGFAQPGALEKANVPGWITKVEQQQGAFLDNPKSWHVTADQAKGAGKLILELNREKLNTDLVATILFDADEAGDLAVQLMDAQGRVISVDLFGNLVDVGQRAMTNTVVVPLEKYPTAQKIVLRRIAGEISVYGVVLYPVMSEAEAKPGAMEELARVLGDPLSPENPLVKNLQGVARKRNVTLNPSAATTKKTTAKNSDAADSKPQFYPKATLPAKGAALPASASEGLIAYFNFEEGAKDATPLKNHGRTKRATMNTGDGVRGKALVFEGRKRDAIMLDRSERFDLKEPLSFTAWINYKSIAPTWGSAILWFGDDRLGRDPWDLHLQAGGELEWRSDRSVTGEPKFVVFDSELQYTAGGGQPTATQHVATYAPKMLSPNTWYFVAGTIEKVSPRGRVMHLYVNGEQVSELQTEETINYDTNPMWLTVGGVDNGRWQNFDGMMDEVRIYNRTLSPAEVRGLYGK